MSYPTWEMCPRRRLSLRQEKELGSIICKFAPILPIWTMRNRRYLTALGNKLILGSREARPEQEFEFFTVQRSAINAFALRRLHGI